MEMEKIVVRDTTVDKAISKGLEQLNLGSEEVTIEIISEGKKGLFGFGSKEAVVEITPKHLPEMREPGNIAVYENDERADYISEHQEEEELDADYNNYEYPQEQNETGNQEVRTEEFTGGTLVDVEYNEDLDEEELFEDDEEDHEEEAEVDEDTRESNRQDAINHVSRYLKDVVSAYGASATVTTTEKQNVITFHIDSNKPGLIIGKHGKIINALQTLAQTIFQHHQQRRVSIVVDVGDYRERRASILENIADRTAERVLRTKQPVFLEPLPAFERKQIHARLSKDSRISTHSEGKEPHRYLVVEMAD